MVSLGTLLSAIASTSEHKSLLFPLLLFPLTIPLLAAAVFTTKQVFQNSVIPWTDFWFQLIVVFSVISVTLGILLFEHVARD